MTQSGIEPATFRIVAQCLNQPRHRVPPNFSIGFTKNTQISNFMKICTVGAKSFHEVGKQTDVMKLMAASSNLQKRI